MQVDNTIREKIERLRKMRYDIEGDEELSLSDDLSDVSEFKEICLALAEEAVERELTAKAIAERIKELTDRKARVLKAAESLRNVVLQCMETRGETAIASPSLTLSVSHLKPGIVVTNESAIPSRFFITQPPKLDMDALKEAVLDDGEIVEGVTRGNGRISLTVRRK